jgi:hypothetical protein
MVLLRFALFSLLAAFLGAGCTSSTRMLMTAELPHRQTNHKKVAVFFQNPPRKSRPLALVSVARDGENATWAVEVLKMEAAQLGADAIANLEVSYSTGLFPTLRVSGLAVKYAGE